MTVGVLFFALGPESSGRLREDYVALPYHADPAEADKLIRRLNAFDFGPVEYTRISNTISVPQNRVRKALVWMAKEKVLPENGEAFESYLLACAGAPETADVRGELLELLREVPGVLDAEIVFHQQSTESVFHASASRELAAVTVVTPPGRKLTDESVRTIVRLVAASKLGVYENAILLDDRSGSRYRSLPDEVMAAWKK